MSESAELVNQFISGAVFFAALGVGLFFVTFWRRSRERLFWLLGVAFWMLALERLILMISASPLLMTIEEESRHWVFVLRLVAFGLIILGVVMKNLPPRRA